MTWARIASVRCQGEAKNPGILQRPVRKERPNSAPLTRPQAPNVNVQSDLETRDYISENTLQSMYAEAEAYSAGVDEPAASHPLNTAPGSSNANGAPPRRVTIAVVGDVHDQWDADSEAALISLGADVVVFLGDFGNEDVELVHRIASVPLNKVVVLGNHDAWYSLTPRGRHRAVRVAVLGSTMRGVPAQGEAVRSMFRALGEDHIGFTAKQYNKLGITFIGGRPFSKGGKRWDDVAAFYSEHYGIGSMEESMHQIVDVALSQPSDQALVVVAHNGPTGLGDQRFSPCGVDWQLPEEDFGDPDLQEALEVVVGQGRPAALVLFGHMHHTLKGGGKRDMAHVDPHTGTVYLNAAIVPRVKRFPSPLISNGSGGEALVGGAGDGQAAVVRGHHFLVVTMEDGVAAAAKHVWVAAPNAVASNVVAVGEGEGKGGDIKEGDMSNSPLPAPSPPLILAEEEVLKSAAAADGMSRVVSYFKAYQSEWAPVVVKRQQIYHQ